MKTGRIILSVAILLLLLVAACLLVTDGQILPEAIDSYYEGTAPEPAKWMPCPYGTGISVAEGAFAVTAVLAYWLLNRKSGNGKQTAKPFPTFWITAAILSGFVLSRLFYCIVNIQFYLDIAGIGAVLKIREGGMSMTGALAGILLSTVILYRGRNDRCLESAAFAVPVFVFFSRAAERFSQVGNGPDIEWGGFFATEGEWGNVVNVSRIEMILAVLVLLLLILLYTKRILTGDELLLAMLVLWGTLQIPCETLRKDEHMIWGFVKAQQIIAFLMAATSLGILTSRRGKGRLIGSAVSSVVLGLEVFALEKALDRNWFEWPRMLIYGMLALLTVAYIIIAFLLIKKKNTIQKQESFQRKT